MIYSPKNFRDFLDVSNICSYILLQGDCTSCSGNPKWQRDRPVVERKEQLENSYHHQLQKRREE
jgi:hypothetical protein